MKSRSLLVFILILSLAVVPSMQLALAASSTSSTTSSSTTTSTTSTAASAPTGSYSQRVDVYLAGTNDYWRVTLTDVNATKPSVVAAEAVPGATAYELTAVKTTSSVASSQLFWAGGYKVLDLPFMPDSGVFLNVTATSQSAAQSVASDMGTYVGANFQQVGSGGGNYTFFSPGDFTVAGEILYTSTVPTAEKGLADITSAFSLATDPNPTATLTGVLSGSSYSHTFSFGSTATNVVASNGSLTLGKALSVGNDSFTSALNATSTKVVIHSLDGLISSSDAATIVNHQSNFSASYTYSVPNNTKFRPNITMLSDPPVLSATRLVGTGSQISGGFITVTLLFRNTAAAGTIDNIALNDNWYASYPSLFSLSAGNSSFTVPTLAAGQNFSQVYVLKVISSASQDLVVPAVHVTYSYSTGGVTVNAGTETNQLEIRTNDPGPALQITAGADISSGSPIGMAGHYVVTVTNTGNDAALSLKVGNFTDESLVQGGGVWKFNTTLPLNSILDRNLTQMFTLQWTAPDGTQGTLQSNPDDLVLSHSGILLPLMQFNVAATLSPGILASGRANATYTLTNVGNAAPASVTVNQAFANGMECNSVLKGNATCTANGLSFSASALAPGSNVGGTLDMAFSTDNYISEPATITTTYAGITLYTGGAGFVVPAGVIVTRVDTPNPVFQGQNDTVVINVANHGSLPVYNVTLLTQPDVFDVGISGALHAEYTNIAADTTESFNYTVGIVTPGNHTTSSITLSYGFGGFAASYTVFPGTVLVYHSVQATTTTKPSTPTEGSDFKLMVNVQNPSTANVTNVALAIHIPQGLTIVNASSGLRVIGRTVTMGLSSLGAGSTTTGTLTVVAGADGSISLGTGTLTFDYAGSTVTGIVNTPAIVVGVDLLVRYELPIGVAVLLSLVVAVYMHRKLTVPQVK